LIELGAGDGAKTSLLVDYFLKQNAAFTYVPIDISEEALHSLTEKFTVRFPNLSIQPSAAIIFALLETFKSKSDRRKSHFVFRLEHRKFRASAGAGFFCGVCGRR
jgi:uncharacterized SAM-dependent methyltransferase